MKDESRAKWPEGMQWDSPACIVLDEETEVVYLASEDLAGKNSDVAEMINRHRFGQIAALPAMVALLTVIGRNDTWSREEIMHKAKPILAQIGEID